MLVYPWTNSKSNRNSIKAAVMLGPSSSMSCEPWTASISARRVWSGACQPVRTAAHSSQKGQQSHPKNAMFDQDRIQKVKWVDQFRWMIENLFQTSKIPSRKVVLLITQFRRSPMAAAGTHWWIVTPLVLGRLKGKLIQKLLGLCRIETIPGGLTWAL